jgi:hypothetical protein
LFRHSHCPVRQVKCIGILPAPYPTCRLQAPTLLDLPNYTVCGLLFSVTYCTMYPQKTAFLPLATSQAGSDSMIAATLCCVLFNNRTGFRRSVDITDLVYLSEIIEFKDELPAVYVDDLCHQSMLTDSVRRQPCFVYPYYLPQFLSQWDHYGCPSHGARAKK